MEVGRIIKHLELGIKNARKRIEKSTIIWKREQGSKPRSSTRIKSKRNKVGFKEKERGCRAKNRNNKINNNRLDKMSIEKWIRAKEDKGVK